MTTRYDLEILVRTKKQGNGIAETDKNVQSFGKSLSGVLGTVTAVTGGIAAAGVVFKQAWDLSKEGAGLIQLEESFNRLNTEVFKTPGLLEDMKNASRDTIKEADLMAGVLTLTAGQTDEMAQQFAQAAPKLVEIAKAANKLNPTLGDTSFLYNSIATGIKRSSPLILDNLGIVVKVGEANEKYAEQLGKSVDQLTAQEKQMALLNATMEAGDQLINQVGGSAGSQQDAWLEWEANIDNATDSLKQILAEGLNPWIKLVNGDYADAIRKIEQDNLAAAEAQDDYTQALARTEQGKREAIASAARTSATYDEFVKKLQDLEAITQFLTPQEKALSRAWYDQEKAVIQTTAAADELNEKMELAREHRSILEDNTRAAEEQARIMSTLSQYYRTPEEAAAEAAGIDRATEARNRAAAAAERMAQVDQRAAEAAYELSQQQERITQASNDYVATVLPDLIDGNYDLTASSERLNQIAFDSVIANGASAETMAKLSLARGELTEAEAKAIIMEAQLVGRAEELGRQLAAGEITIGKYQEALDQLVAGTPYNAEANVETGDADKRLGAIISKLNELDGRKTRSVHEVVTREKTESDGGGGKSGSKPSSSSGSSTGPDGAFASGVSSFTVPSRFNERAGRPFVAHLDGGERIDVTPAGQAPANGGMSLHIGTINAYGAGVGKEVKREIEALMSQYGRQADVRTRV